MVPGQKLQARAGLVEIQSTEKLYEKQPVYNIEIDSEHVYEITPLGMLVHKGDEFNCSRYHELKTKKKLDATEQAELDRLENQVKDNPNLTHPTAPEQPTPETTGTGSKGTEEPKSGEKPDGVMPNKAPYRTKPGEVVDPTKVDIYRGGESLSVKPGETKVIDGKVQPTHGVSLETDPVGLDRFGGAKKVVSIPDELQIIQRGKRDTHLEIVPKIPMTPERFQELVNKIRLE